MITLEEVKNYSRIDLDDDDTLLTGYISAAESYLKNATGKEYPEIDHEGNPINYELEKIFLLQLIAYWYEKRSPIGGVGEDFCYATKSLMLQLQMR